MIGSGFRFGEDEVIRGWALEVNVGAKYWENDVVIDYKVQINNPPPQIEAATIKLALELALADAEADTEGEDDGDWLALGEAEAEALGLALAEALGLRLALGEAEARRRLGRRHRGSPRHDGQAPPRRGHERRRQSQSPERDGTAQAGTGDKVLSPLR